MSDEMFAQRLASLMEQRGMTAAALAERLTITPQAVHKWLNGAEISLPNLRELARLLKVNWVWLRFGEEAVDEMVLPQHGTDSVVDRHRARLVRELMDSERRHRWALDMLDIGVWEIDLATERRIWNRTMRTILGIPQDLPASSDAIYQMMGAHMIPVMEDMVARSLNGECVVGTFDILTRPGEQFESISARVDDADGLPVKVMGMVRRIDQQARPLTQMLAALRN
ncbi:Transcriptional regulator, contains XRE-family HTH domain [Noviherbaspirillum humi]|uniref:Transcriptional regulator, contains XRE-family HTH domain n=1 Tax=Noviherbaspirillum humi TaxID=1688639 RepID=A0A239E811_9BURK|nr:helix-turn-helix domain-containing protein [Noviherbaspirillum humi]SNS40890.1 Transcriptional regulator, contains XRE-family HTH domain [Noviherbaspirillum humi]